MAESSVRPRFTILVAVWGTPYIERLDRFGFSSLLAPGNLPALAVNAEIELVLLTSAEDEEVFNALPSMGDLRRHARIRYVAIDDLIAPGQYSTTLHLAFTRGVALFGDEMLDIHFVFWNADFVLSDGALNHLGDLIAAGHKVVITGTLRANAEQAEGLLTQRRSPKTGVLVASSRDLVDLAFRFQHPHHVAKIANQSICWTTMPSQLLWRVNATTQLGRFFKAFMFCLKPTRVISSINGPCDYAFVPELCPGEPQHLVQDSDDAFILELQPAGSEQEFIQTGPRNEDERRACMAEWLTAEHLDTGRRVVTFRSSDEASLPEIAAEKKKFDAYFEAFMRDIPAPHSHRAQYYWLFGVASWKINRDRYRPSAALPPELNLALSVADLKHGSNDRHRRPLPSDRLRRGLKGTFRDLCFGRPHLPRRFHPDSASTPILAAAANAARAKAGASGALLAVAPLHSWADIAMPLDDPLIFRFEPTPADFWPLQGPPHVDAVLIYNRPGIEFDAGGLLQRISGALVDGAHVTLLWHDPGLKGRHDWIDSRTKQALTAFGQLDQPDLRTFEASKRDKRYATAFYRAMPHFADPNARPAGWSGRLKLAFAMLVRATGLGSRAPSGRPIVASLTGRFRRSSIPPQPATAAVSMPHANQPTEKFQRERTS